MVTQIVDEACHSIGFNCPMNGSIGINSPIDGSRIASVDRNTDVDLAVEQATKAFEWLRNIPAPERGELIRLFGEELRRAKQPLGRLVTAECGKIISEGYGEVQEMIDICDFAVGLSRQLYGLTIKSERPSHVMYENWLPLGPVGVISAFNFPVAVWAWNFALAVVCGDPVIWKPSLKTPLTALACQHLFKIALNKWNKDAVDGISTVMIGDTAEGANIVNHHGVKLVSATGSCGMGRVVGPNVARRFGKCLLELGGNNAAIVTSNARLSIALPSIVFGAIGTAGQRCTTTRRVFIHESIFDDVVKSITNAYESIKPKIGDPFNANTLVGPLIDSRSVENMMNAIDQAQKEGGKLVVGGKSVDGVQCGEYVEPAVVVTEEQTDIVKNETFAPILYAMPYDTLDNAMRMHNDVPQGLSSAIFTDNVQEAEFFKHNSDCGIANVNIGTSGAEIGGAFGGEKETGGGRESGSDSWKAYCRRQTSTTYYGDGAPKLAQGVKFDL